MVKKTAREGKRTLTPSPGDRWETVSGMMDENSVLSKRLPVNRVETPCAVGMIVTAVDGDGEAVVIGITPAHCIMRHESGEVAAVPWFGVSIECVVPAGMPLARPCGSKSQEARHGETFYPPAAQPLPQIDAAPESNYAEAQRLAISLNSEDRKKFAQWFAEWDRAITPVQEPAQVEPSDDEFSSAEPEYEQRENWYTPELAEWFSGRIPISDHDARTFEIHEIAYETLGTPRPIQVTGPLVATVTVAPEFGSRDAAAIARLIGRAPTLYQALKQVARHGLNDTTGLADFNAAVEAMFNAVDHYPYAMPESECDEDICLENNKCRGKIPLHGRAAQVSE